MGVNAIAPVDDVELEKRKENNDSGPIEPIQGKLTGPLILTIFTIVIGCSFQFGYHTGNINSSKPMVERFMRRKCGFLGDITWPWAAVVALFPLGSVIGTYIGSPLADRYGRKMSLFLNLIPATIAAVLFLLFYLVKCWPLLFPARFLIGINSGITSSTALPYITEIAPVNYRGMLGSCHQLIVTLGILVANFFSFNFIFGTDSLWIVIFLITFVPVVVQLILLLFCPESPQYTLVFRKDEAKATKDLKRLRKTSMTLVKQEIENFKKLECAEVEKVSVMALRKRKHRWTTFIACFMMFMQQFSGINATMYYSGVIFEKAGLTGTTNTLATCGLMIANVLMTLVSTYLVDHPRCGRRFLLLSGLVGMIICTIISVIALSLVDNEIAVSTFQVIAVIFLVLFIVSFAAGAGSIPWFYVTELFSSDARTSAASVACSVNWISNFLVGLLFPVIQEYLRTYTFLIFTAFLILSLIFVAIYVPETKGRSVEENQAAAEKNRPRWI